MRVCFWPKADILIALNSSQLFLMKTIVGLLDIYLKLINALIIPPLKSRNSFYGPEPAEGSYTSKREVANGFRKLDRADK